MSKLKDLYKQIWEQRPHRCEVCGYPIHQPVAHVFSHVYSRGAHPSLKYEPRNIEIWCDSIIRNDGEQGCHTLYHRDPYAFQRRARRYGYKKPKLSELKQSLN